MVRKYSVLLQGMPDAPTRQLTEAQLRQEFGDAAAQQLLADYAVSRLGCRTFSECIHLVCDGTSSFALPHSSCGCQVGLPNTTPPVCCTLYVALY